MLLLSRMRIGPAATRPARVDMVSSDGASQEARAVAAALSDPMCAAIIDRMPTLGLGEWWLTAGAVFQNIWNAVDGRPPGYGVKDYDVFYFDDADLSWGAEDRVIAAARELFSDLDADVEVRNQARVHLWYEGRFGTSIAPFTSATDAIGSFASTTCCVGITRQDEDVRLYAPYGLDDVFAMHLRPLRRIAPQHVYEAKVAQYGARWPSITSDAW